MSSFQERQEWKDGDVEWVKDLPEPPDFDDDSRSRPDADSGVATSAAQAASQRTPETPTQESHTAMAGPTLPRDNLFRAILDADIEFRAPDPDDDVPEGYIGVMRGHFAVYDQWTEINSIFEGHFMERFAPRSFTKTMREQREKIRPLFQHGRDPQAGDKPLGPIRELRDDGDLGAYYEVPLLDTSYNRDLLPGLKAGLYGASHRFRVMRQEVDDNPAASESNPRGLPERTIKEAQLLEFGPVTFPAYDGATAGVRSITDQVLFGDLVADRDRLRELVELYSTPRVQVQGADLAARETEAEAEAEDADGESVRETDETSRDSSTDTQSPSDAAPPEAGAGQTAHSSTGRRDTPSVFGPLTGKDASWRLSPAKTSRPGRV
jgi:HK97 family phage prohead protease